MTEGQVPYPHILRRGELVRKVLIVTIEFGEGDLRQVACLTRRLPGGTFSCCYHYGRLEGGVFRPEAADCLAESASAQEADLRLEAVLAGVKASTKDRFLTHVIYNLSDMDSLEAQLEFLAAKGLAHLARAAD
jgi:hypothetical protein